MKIMLLNIEYYPNIEGGAEISTQKLAEELAKNNEVYVLCNGTELKVPEEINGVKVIRLPVKKKYRNKVEYVLVKILKLYLYFSLKKVLKSVKPEVLHTNNLHEFSVIVWRVAHELKIPIIHTLRDYTLARQNTTLKKIIVKKNSEYVDILTAPSKFTLDYFVEINLFSKAKKVVIPNAIDFDQNEMVKLENTKLNCALNLPTQFAYLGRLLPEKGIDWLITIFSQTTLTAKLHIYGQGVLGSELLEIISDDKRIILHEFLNQEALYAELKSIDVIVAPSLWDEPFGRIILDAYRSVCPVIITNQGGMPEVVENNKTGIIVTAGNDEELKKALLYFSKQVNVKSMFQDIIRKINTYSLKKQVADFEKLYESRS